MKTLEDYGDYVIQNDLRAINYTLLKSATQSLFKYIENEALIREITEYENIVLNAVCKLLTEYKFPERTEETKWGGTLGLVKMLNEQAHERYIRESLIKINENNPYFPQED